MSMYSIDALEQIQKLGWDVKSIVLKFPSEFPIVLKFPQQELLTKNRGQLPVKYIVGI